MDTNTVQMFDYKNMSGADIAAYYQQANETITLLKKYLPNLENEFALHFFENHIYGNTWKDIGEGRFDDSGFVTLTFRTIMPIIGMYIFRILSLRGYWVAYGKSENGYYVSINKSQNGKNYAYGLLQKNTNDDEEDPQFLYSVLISALRYIDIHGELPEIPSVE